MARTPAQADPSPRWQRRDAELASLHAVAEAVSDAIVCADASGRITLWTGGAETIFGWNAQEAVGMPLTHLMPERLRSAHLTAFRRAADGGPARLLGGPPLDVDALRKDGSEFLAELTIARGEHDGSFFVGVVRDITHRRRADQELALAEERFRSAFDDASIGMLMATTEGRYLRVNRAFCAFVGYDEQELLGQHYDAVAHPDERAADRELAEQLLAGEHQTLGREKRYVRKDGEVVWGELRGTIIRDEDSAPLHFLVQVQDITERRRAAAELARSNAELGHFAHLASHDLNEPLRIVDGFLRLLETRTGDRLGEDGRRYLTHALAGTTRMRDMIAAFLDFARSGGEVSHNPLVLDQLAREAVAVLGAAIAERRVVVRIDDLPEAEGDPALIRQVLQNLLGNAIRHAEAEQPRVRVCGSRRDGVVEVSVADNGRGVPAADRERVFEMFARHGEVGTGLGLAICRRIIERHGGRIWIEEAAGGGADVRFTLPAP